MVNNKLNELQPMLFVQFTSLTYSKLYEEQENKFAITSNPPPIFGARTRQLF